MFASKKKKNTRTRTIRLFAANKAVLSSTGTGQLPYRLVIVSP